MKRKPGEAVSASRKAQNAIEILMKFTSDAARRNKHDEWRRGKGVLLYLEGHLLKNIARQLTVSPASVANWLKSYDVHGVDGLKTRVSPGPKSKLTDAQKERLDEIIKNGAKAAGLHCNVWTGKMLVELIEQKFGVRYNLTHIHWLLHSRGFSLQRPRKRLAKVDWVKQDDWLKNRLPKIKKRQKNVMESSCSRMRRATG